VFGFDIFIYIDAPPKGKIPGMKYMQRCVRKTFDFLGSTASIEDENINKSISSREFACMHVCVKTRRGGKSASRGLFLYTPPSVGAICMSNRQHDERH
jgi:hypothetical protein